MAHAVRHLTMQRELLENVGRGKNLDNVLKLAVIVQLGSPSALFRW
jgi:hypothetical protein